MESTIPVGQIEPQGREERKSNKTVWGIILSLLDMELFFNKENTVGSSTNLDSSSGLINIVSPAMLDMIGLLTLTFAIETLSFCVYKQMVPNFPIAHDYRSQRDERDTKDNIVNFS